MCLNSCVSVCNVTQDLQLEDVTGLQSTSYIIAILRFLAIRKILLVSTSNPHFKYKEPLSNQQTLSNAVSAGTVNKMQGTKKKPCSCLFCCKCVVL